MISLWGDLPRHSVIGFVGEITVTSEYKTIRLKAKGLRGAKVDESRLDAMMNDLGRDT